MLIDTVEVELRAGRGGDGVIAWRREKFVPKGGPDGGDGGRGGNVILRASHNLDTLSSFRYRKLFQAQNGTNGANKRKSGSFGDDLILLVPVGTRVTNLTTDRVMADLAHDKQDYIVARGGEGGLGNVHFARADNQNPFESTSGKPGQSIKVRLELQMVADIALIGQPNAGKSSLIQALTGASARIGAFPFSTTEPILGVLSSGRHRVTLIDLPGLIEGAHRGKGLGFQFLRHTQRVKALAQIIDATETDRAHAQEEILQELKRYDDRLLELPRIVVFNKTDLLTATELNQLKKQFPKSLLVSALTKSGLAELKDELVTLGT